MNTRRIVAALLVIASASILAAPEHYLSKESGPMHPFGNRYLADVHTTGDSYHNLVSEMQEFFRFKYTGANDYESSRRSKYSPPKPCHNGCDETLRGLEIKALYGSGGG